MAVTTSIDSDRSLVRISLSGETTVPEMVAAYDALFSDVEFESNMAAVWELSQFDLKRRPINDVRDLARQLRNYAGQRGDNYKAAIVTTRPVDYQLLRIYIGMMKLVGSQVVIRVFNSLDGAYQWLSNE